MQRVPHLLVGCLLHVAASALAAQPSIWRDLPAGQYGVGFRTVDTVDLTRSFPDASGAMMPRPMRLYVWYPAPPTASERRVRWSEIAAESAPFGRAAESVAAVDSTSTIQMKARRNSTAASGRFPVVMLAPGDPGPFTLSAELLASHGFVVVGMARRNHATVESRESTPNQASIDAEVEDLEFSLGAARGWRMADARRIGVMGFSSSSLSILAFTFRSRVPSAVASVEGWEGMKAGTPIVEAIRHFDPAAFRAAYMYLGKAAEEASPDFQKTSAFLDSVRFAPRWRVSIDSATHGDFLFDVARPRPRAFVRANEYLLAFFRAQLGAEQVADWLPSRRDAAMHVVAYPLALPLLGAEAFFRLAETDPSAALRALREGRQRDSTFRPFTESSLGRLANLARRERPRDATVLAEIVVVGYPTSARAAVRWSDALWTVGRQDEARSAARRGLDLIDRDSSLAADQREPLRTRMQARIAP